MRIVVTGSSGRVGRAIVAALCETHEVVGVDRAPFATTSIVDDFTTSERLLRALDGAGALIHTAALHAPQVGHVPDSEFQRINVDGSARLAEQARAAGVRAMIFTSTTALYGDAVVPGRCTWIDEAATPQPVSMYHRTKLEAEGLLEAAATPRFAIRVIRMSRCFPEPAPAMAAYRLHRGVDVRDVADAHVLAIEGASRGDDLASDVACQAPFERFVVSGATPFVREDIAALATDAPAVLAVRAPGIVAAFATRGWPLPRTIDRVYAPTFAMARLGWHPRHGFGEVLAQLDRRSLEVLPVSARVVARPE